MAADHIRRTSAPSLEHQAKKFLFGLVRHGTTTVEIKTGFGLDESGEMKMLRVLSHLSNLGVTVIPTFFAPSVPHADFSGTLDEHVAWLCKHLLAKVKSRQIAQFVDAFCDPAGLNLASDARSAEHRAASGIRDQVAFGDHHTHGVGADGRGNGGSQR